MGDRLDVGFLVVWAGSLREDCCVHLPVLAEESGLEEGVAECVAGGAHVVPRAAREVLGWRPREWGAERKVEERKGHIDVGGGFGVVGEEELEVVWRRDNVFVSGVFSIP